MPKKVRPVDPEWSQDLDAALVAYGTAVRMQILRHLRIKGPSMRYQIAESTGISQSVLVQSLGKLESVGVIEANLPASERSTRALTYSLNRPRAEHLLRLVQKYVHGRGEMPPVPQGQAEIPK
ncbi:ArsR/SmtB family transcription factor [Arthrobacter cavernae]|uniref:ArsR family transcriptional regulator n=1 Tax=Arthrobacter cavernae TaxID=2817681 RepID=A0A939KQ08_9MICC|nr:ArsR family transcriptional regulator [Arthrobacter cavernae]MBO1269505.1 ArsR family transcriptional regulator [Arthrobacter cavernae]